MADIATQSATATKSRSSKTNQNGEKKVRTPRKPRNYDTLFKRALKMPLEQRNMLKNQLRDSIAKEVETLKKQAEQAALFIES